MAYLVSIITVCYNSEKTIKKTMQSVLEQTYSNIEYIIIDGGSTDGTLQIVYRYAEKFKNRIKIVSEKDNGIFDAMNKGIRLANGTLIGIINSDDYYEKDAVENVIKHIDVHRPQIYYGMMRVVDNEMEKRIEFESHNFLNQTMIPHCTCFVPKAVYGKYGMFNLKYKYVADYDLMYRYFQTKEIEFIPIYCVIANFSEYGVSATYEARKEALEFKHAEKMISTKKYYLMLLKLKMEKIAEKWIL